MTTLDPRPAVTTARPRQVDARGPRFAAAVTVVVLATALLALGSTLGLVLLLVQTAAFALGALVGLHAQPYGAFFRVVVRPRLSPPTAFEDVAPPRFAQAVGLGFALVGLAGLLAGATALAYAAVGLALAAAFLNAAFDFCLGCEMYLVLRRLRPARA